MIITGDDIDETAVLKTHLACQFGMKDLRSLTIFWVLKWLFLRKFFFSQSKYTIDIVEHAHLIDSQTLDTPLELNVRYFPFDCTSLSDRTLYRIVGNLVIGTSQYYTSKYCIYCSHF